MIEDIIPHKLGYKNSRLHSSGQIISFVRVNVSQCGPARVFSLRGMPLVVCELVLTGEVGVIIPIYAVASSRKSHKLHVRDKYML
jgi:hypothetical protein